jgi:predicted dehydrogenase
MMNRASRRSFLKCSAAAAACAGAQLCTAPWSRAAGANDDVRLAVIGVGSRTKIGGQGRNEIRSFRQVPGVRIVALCDVDEANLGAEVESFQQRNEKVAAYADVRRLLDSPDIDAVVVTTPNHWHALVTIWACQAGKDVYVQKPASHNIFEGRKMVEAARKYGRIVQCPNGSRGPNGHAEAVDYVRQGKLGSIRLVRHVHFSPRCSIGKVSGPQPIPATLDYNLWSGPAPIEPLVRQNLHYDWHWQWPYGNGELGNWGIHHLDGCRLFVGGSLPRHVITIGGRFGYQDDGHTPNTLIVYYDYEPGPVLSEFRALPRDQSFHAKAVAGRDSWGANAMDSYQGISIGKVIHCEHGDVISTVNSHTACDASGKEIKRFQPTTPAQNHNFIEAVRSRRADDLVSDVLQGHLSTVLVHLGNISHRVGRSLPDGEIRERIAGNPALAAAYERLQAHLMANGVDLDKTPATLGAMLTFDPDTERFVGEFSQAANKLVARDYRAPFVVPDQV